MSDRDPEVRRLAEEIATRLFTMYGGDQVAQRLVLTIDEPERRDLGGLCRSAAVGRIENVLRPFLAEREAAARDLGRKEVYASVRRMLSRHVSNEGRTVLGQLCGQLKSRWPGIHQRPNSRLGGVS